MEGWQKVKVGDKVAVRVLDVCEASGSVKIGMDNWLWPMQYEPVAVADNNGNKPKFKVGDRVRRIFFNNGTNMEVGETGTVVDVINEYTVRVDVDGGERSLYTCTHYLTPAPLTIREGRYYKTRDGRKVGPMRPWDSSLDWPWESDGYLWKDDGENYDKDSVHTIVAEWADEPAAPSSNGTIYDWYYGKASKTTGFTVPLDAPEFGGAGSKFKVGDRVEIIDVGSCPERYLGTQFTIDNDEDDFDGEQAWSGRDHKSPYRFKESQLRLVAEATTAQEPPASIADIVRRLERLEAKQPIEPEHCIGDKVTLSATVTGMNKRRVNVVIDGVPQPGGSLAVPPAALRAA